MRLETASDHPLLTPVVALLVIGLSLPTATPAQQETFSDRLEVSEVLLDVLVTDRAGQMVRGLSADDFEVKRDGDPLEITGVTFHRTSYEVEPGAAGHREIPASRFFILLFHDQRFNSGGQGRLMRRQLDAGRQARRWIEDEMGPSDWIAVASYGVKLQLHQDFTQDKTALARAIDGAATGGRAEPNWRDDAAEDTIALSRNLPRGKQLRDQTTNPYDGIKTLAEATRNITGRKNLVLFSVGFGELDGFTQTATPDRRYYPGLQEALNDNHVSVYSVDLTPSDTDHLQSNFLNTLAVDSGGAYYQGGVSFVTPLRRIADENSGYYLLSVRARHARGESGYQKIKVDVPGQRLVVRAPNGYRYGAAGPVAQ